MSHVLILESNHHIARAMETEAISRHFEARIEHCIENGVKAFLAKKDVDVISISNPIAEYSFGVMTAKTSIRFIDYLVEHNYKGLVIHYTAKNVYSGEYRNFPFMLTEIIREDKNGIETPPIGRWGYACSEII